MTTKAHSANIESPKNRPLMQNEPNILLLAGTSESAAAATLLAEAGFRVWVSTATDAALDTGNHPNITRRTGRLDVAGLTDLIRTHQICALVDVSHPYAEALHRDAYLTVVATDIPYIYYERPAAYTPEDNIILAANHEQAARLACGRGHPVLLTIGARHIHAYGTEAAKTGIPLIARVLDDPASIDACKTAGMHESAIITGRGPFTLEQNIELIQRFSIGTVVTKDGGTAGGFPAKQEAARQQDCHLILVQRPPRPHGQACNNLADLVQTTKELT